MGEFIRDAGLGIYPVMIFGAVAFAVALRYALAPSRALLPLVIGFAAATILAGALGTSVGLQTTARYVAGTVPAERWLFVVGLRESLNNMTAALFAACVNALLATVGAYRFAKGQARNNAGLVEAVR